VAAQTARCDLAPTAVKHAGATGQPHGRNSMFVANTHTIRLANDQDAIGLRRLAELDSQRPLAGRVLLGEIDGTPAAAISLADGQVIADPFRNTVVLVSYLRVRARALQTDDAAPPLPDRIRAAVSARYGTRAGGPMARNPLVRAQPLLTGRASAG
jgi:hypothetical protein